MAGARRNSEVGHRQLQKYPWRPREGDEPSQWQLARTQLQARGQRAPRSCVAKLWKTYEPPPYETPRSVFESAPSHATVRFDWCFLLRMIQRAMPFCPLCPPRPPGNGGILIFPQGASLSISHTRWQRSQIIQGGLPGGQMVGSSRG